MLCSDLSVKGQSSDQYGSADLQTKLLGKRIYRIAISLLETFCHGSAISDTQPFFSLGNLFWLGCSVCDTDVTVWNH